MGNTPLQQTGPQLVVSKRDGAYRKRVPSVLTKEQQEDIKHSFEAGRNAHQISSELSCSIALVLEMVLRQQQKTLKQQQEWLKEIDLIVRNPTPPAVMQFIRRPIVKQAVRESKKEVA